MHNLVLICKKTGKRFTDINNMSGRITQHLTGLYDDLNIPPTTHLRRRYRQIHGKNWYDDYFTTIEVDDTEVRVCSLCGWETTDVEDMSGKFTTHLESDHHISLSQYLQTFPMEIKYHPSYNNEINHINEELGDEVICMICGKKMQIITATHLRSQHGIELSEYIKKYPNSPIKSLSTSEKIRSARRESGKIIKPTWTSTFKTEIMNFVSGLDVEVVYNGTINKRKTDIVVPSKKIGIQCIDLYNNTEGSGKRKNHHLKKTISSLSRGYSLYHIFEDEWVEKGELVKSKIKYLLNISDNIRISGRKTVIKEIDESTKTQFLELNSIYGDTPSSISYGAYYENELLGVITFMDKLSRVIRGEGEYVMSQFVIKHGYIVNGLFSKFIKHFITTHNPISIISFADKRWVPIENNNLYTKFGFILSGFTKPMYYYYNPSVSKYKRFNRDNFDGNRLKLRYPDLDLNKTEREITQSLGYERVWDCGQFIYKRFFNEKK